MRIINESTTVIIDDKQLQDAFPELYSEYKNLFGGKRPKIYASPEEKYTFGANIQDSMSDYFMNDVTIFKTGGKIFRFDSSDESPANHALANKLKGVYHLQPGEAVMVCDTGYYKSCNLYVHPSFMNQAMLPNSSKSDLSLAEQFVLLIIKSTTSAYRMKNFAYPYTSDGKAHTNNSGWEADAKELKKNIAEYGKTYDEAWKAICLALQSKGFAKVNSAGSVQLTLDGKNKAIAMTGSRF